MIATSQARATHASDPDGPPACWESRMALMRGVIGWRSAKARRADAMVSVGANPEGTNIRPMSR